MIKGTCILRGSVEDIIVTIISSAACPAETNHNCVHSYKYGTLGEKCEDHTQYYSGGHSCYCSWRLLMVDTNKQKELGLRGLITNQKQRRRM